MIRLLLLVPIIELLLLILLADLTSAQLVFGWLFAAAVLGVLLLRRRGFQSLRRMRGGLAAGQMPGESISKTAIHVIAGVLLIVPGVLTDVVALAVLFPPTRRWLQYYLMWRFQRRMGARFAAMAGMASQLGRSAGRGQGFDGRTFDRDQVIDVKVLDPDSRAPDRR
jgi:UPF0716 protein FxsA